MTKADILNGLFLKYKLTNEDVFKSKSQGWTIVTRTGIDKIQAAKGIKINYESVVIERDFVVIKAIGIMDDKYIETYGEADKGPQGNCRQNYPVAMAEKRAMSRVVLKLTGFYELGAYGIDEADDFNVKRSDRENIIKETL